MTLNTAEDQRFRSKPKGWLSIGELTQKAQVTRATIHHYLAMELLPSPVKTSRQMAYYDPQCVARLKLIRELQEKRFMPLSAIKRVLEDSGEEGLRLIDSHLLEEHRRGRKYTRQELLRLYPVGERVFRELVKAGVIASGKRLSEEDARILSAIHQMREAGLNEAAGFQPSELKVYAEALEKLIDREFELFNPQMLGKLPPSEVARLAKVAIHFSSQILAALHYRKLMERLALINQNNNQNNKKPSKRRQR